ncbi:MAG: HAAS signaling domain-containing protein [Egibacteraceae bacterium]
MTTVHTDHLVEDYLRRLDAAASALSPPRRAELVSEIREHIDNALHAAVNADEVTVRNVLERLGPPEEIATEAAGAATGEPAGALSRAGALEIATIVALIVPYIGLVVGGIMVMLSPVWSKRDRLKALLWGLAPLLLGLLFFAVLGLFSSPLGAAEILLALTFSFFGRAVGPSAAVYLTLRLRAYSRQAPAQP